MNAAEVLEVLTYLAEGYDPETGEVLPEDGPYHSVRIVRSLFFAIKAIEHASKPVAKTKVLPKNTGAKWKRDEEQRLIAAFNAGQSVEEIAANHQRKTGGIISRLRRLGLMDPPPAQAPVVLTSE